ncbi:MAG: 3'-5' exonuclease, partial [Actinomycetota bacterium]
IGAFIVEDGLTIDSWASLVDPGLATIGATQYHHITAAMLRGKPNFARVADRVRELLTAPGKTVFLVGHSVKFDAKRLRFEFHRIGQEIPAVLTLDTMRLAPAAGYGTGGEDLATAAFRFGITTSSQHDASTDALLARDIAIASIRKLAEMGHTDLRDFAIPFDDKRPAGDDDEDDDPEKYLPPEHIAAHSQPMTTRAEWKTQLELCLGWDCPILQRRMAEAANSDRNAQDVFSWGITQLARTDLSLATIARIADGTGRALRNWRDSETSRATAYVTLERALRLLGTRSDWNVCDGTTTLCDRCVRQQPHRCRFYRTAMSAIWTVLFERDDNMLPVTAQRYLFGGGWTPLDGSSWYAHFAEHCPRQAVRGAAFAARSIRSAGDGAVALEVVEALWAEGDHWPEVAELYAALIEDLVQFGEDHERWQAAVAICDASLAGGDGSSDWDRVRAKQKRLQRRIDARERRLLAEQKRQAEKEKMAKRAAAVAAGKRVRPLRVRLRSDGRPVGRPSTAPRHDRLPHRSTFVKP